MDNGVHYLLSTALGSDWASDGRRFAFKAYREHDDE